MAITTEQLKQLAAAPPVRDFLGQTGIVRTPGLNLFDSAKAQAGRVDHWDTVAEAANADRETYKQLLRGLATTTGLRRGDQFEQAIDAGSDQIAKIAPYLMTAAPDLWDQLHGGQGSVASLASSIAKAHPDRTPLENASLAQTVHRQMPPGIGMASRDLGQVYRTMVDQGLMGQKGGLESQEASNRLLHVGTGLRALIDANRELDVQKRAAVVKALPKPGIMSKLIEYPGAKFREEDLRSLAKSVGVPGDDVQLVPSPVGGSGYAPNSSIVRRLLHESGVKANRRPDIVATIPGTSRGVVAHELGHARVHKRVGSLQQASRVVGNVGLAAGAISGSFGYAPGARIGTAAALPMLADELAASHFGGVGLSRFNKDKSVSDKAQSYLSAYRGLPTYAVIAALPETLLQVNRRLSKRATAVDSDNKLASAGRTARSMLGLAALGGVGAGAYGLGRLAAPSASKPPKPAQPLPPISHDAKLKHRAPPSGALARTLFAASAGPEPPPSAISTAGQWLGFHPMSEPELLRHQQTADYTGPPGYFVNPPKKPQLLLRLQNPATAAAARQEFDRIGMPAFLAGTAPV